MLLRLFGFLFLILSLLFLLPQQTLAAEYFTRDYAVIYTVRDTGTTNVSIDVKLTNTTSDYYASSDTIQVGFENVTNVTARDPDGPLQPKVTRTEEGNSIELQFSKRVVGKDNSLNFSINFDTFDVARQQGSIWEITVPGIANPEQYAHFNVEVRVPDAFGKPTYIKPVQRDNSLLFSKEQLGASGISIAYGDKQFYNLDLVYHLRNTNLFPIKTEIALPPSTSYQTVSIDAIEPKPENVKLDADGNWLAEYLLLPSQKFDVRVKGRVAIELTPTRKEILSPQQRTVYTREQPYWQASNSEIKKLAEQLQTPQAIYEYVIETLTYDFERVTKEQPRLGAAQSLANPSSAVCLEFTDLFVAIARAGGIPAREVNGFAYTHNQKQRPLSLSQDILHAWPEYYDSKSQRWIMVDPTWGNTTGGIDYFNVFDLDHIVFVRKGVDSSYPIPAGGYKFSGDEKKKDVGVSFASEFKIKQATLESTPLLSQQFLSGLPIKGVLNIRNTGSTLSQATIATIASQTLSPAEQFIQIDPLPPFATQEVAFTFAKTPFLTNKTHTFTMSLQNRQEEHNIRVVPYYVTKMHLIGGIGIALFTIIIFIIARKTGRLRIFR